MGQSIGRRTRLFFSMLATSVFMSGCIDPRDFVSETRFVVTASHDRNPAEFFCVQFSSFYGDFGYNSEIFEGQNGVTTIDLRDFPLPLTATVSIAKKPGLDQEFSCMGDHKWYSVRVPVAASVAELDSIRDEAGNVLIDAGER
ncbi:MAG TPA: hypothetical protein PLA85_07570 [Micropepsaceae bacterium]|nr:hypothetical protein [Micropepsaceae bacterium]